VVDIDFHYPHLEPYASDWIGLYPCSDAYSVPPFNKEPKVWAYTCYDRMCRYDTDATPSGNITFDDETLPFFGSQGIYKKIRDLEPGCYVVLLNRIEGLSAPPYYGICEGNEIMIGPSSVPTPGPAPLVTPVPTPGPAALMTSKAGVMCCPEGFTGLKPYGDCDSFYNCIGGIAIGGLVDCAPGTLFDADIQTCNWDDEVTCEANSCP